MKISEFIERFSTCDQVLVSRISSILEKKKDELNRGLSAVGRPEQELSLLEAQNIVFEWVSGQSGKIWDGNHYYGSDVSHLSDKSLNIMMSLLGVINYLDADEAMTQGLETSIGEMIQSFKVSIQDKLLSNISKSNGTNLPLKYKALYNSLSLETNDDAFNEAVFSMYQNKKNGDKDSAKEVLELVFHAVEAWQEDEIESPHRRRVLKHWFGQSHAASVWDFHKKLDQRASHAGVDCSLRRSHLDFLKYRVKSESKENRVNSLRYGLAMSFGCPWSALFGLPFVAYAANPGVAAGIVIASIVALCLVSALSVGMRHQVRLSKETVQVSLFNTKVDEYKDKCIEASRFATA